MAEIVSLADGVAAVVRDGDILAMEGFTHLIPFAAGHEVIRQGRRELTLVRMTPDVIYDQLIGAGCARRLVFSWGGNPGMGSLHRFRDAVQQGWPVPLEVEEHSHAGMANRYVAGASGLPFAVLRGYAGTDLANQTESVRPIVCPFTGEVLTAVPALRPDAAVVHAQRADRAGNVQVWGIIGVHKEAVLASRRSLVTVEEARAGIGWEDLSVVELNEAFAAQSLACLDSWPELDPELVNPNGGAVALGHPIGCSGARILGTLARELRRRGGHWGLAAICIAVGQGLAVVLEA